MTRACPSSSSCRRAVRRLLGLWFARAAVLIVFAGFAAAPASAAGWEEVKVGGRDHVSVESLRRFYEADIGPLRSARSGASLVLENRKLELRLTVGGHECFMNGVKFVFAHPVIEVAGKVCVSQLDLIKLIDPVLRPNFIRNAESFRTVILDPGHGGDDAGAVSASGREADFNLEVARRIRELLVRDGLRVVMTRETDRFLTLQQRVDQANAIAENAIFISIHFNSGRSGARGIETFTLSPPGVSHYGRGLIAADQQRRAGNEHDSANIALATSVHGTFLRRLKPWNTFDRGIKRARFNVLSGVRHPAILIEGGFMSHPQESRFIATPAYQNALAHGVKDAVTKYRLAVAPKRTSRRQ